MAKFISKPGSVLTLVLALMIGGSLSGAVYWTVRLNELNGVMLLVPTDADLDITLRRAGLDPEHLAAAGLSSGDVSTLISNASTDLNSRFDTLSTADSDYASAKSSHDRLGRIVRSGLATAQNLTDFNTAKTDMNTAASTRQTNLDAFHTATVASLSAAKKAALSMLTDNGGWKTPAQYRAADRTEANWITLRNALANDRISAERGEAPDSTLHQFLLDADSNSDVAAAKNRITSNLATIEAAYATNVYGS